MSCYRKEVSVMAQDETLYMAYPLLMSCLEANLPEDITFAEFLRSHNTNNIPPVPCRQIRGGITALSVEMTSPWPGFHDAQRLNVFHAWNGRVLLLGERYLVPHDHTWFATCLLLAPRFWREANKVKERFAMTATPPSKLATIMAMITGWRVYIDRYISGEVISVQPVIVQREMEP